MITREELKGLYKEIPYKWRKGPGGKELPYIDARQVMDLLDAVCGPENWQRVYQDIGGHLFCGIGINISGQWVWKWDRGSESNIEAEKGESSDAFKRAAVNWGVGRFLYSIKNRPQGQQRPQPKPQPITPKAEKPPGSVSDLQWATIRDLRKALKWEQKNVVNIIASRFGIIEENIAGKMTAAQANELINEMSSLAESVQKVGA